MIIKKLLFKGQILNKMDLLLLGDLHSFGGCPIDINVFAEYFNKRNIGVVFAGGSVNPEQIKKIIYSTPITKQLAIFYHNDYSGPIDVPYNNIVLFRSSLLATKSKKFESIFPVTWVNNIVLPLH